MRVMSTFTGIGGFEVGIRNAAERTNHPVEFVGYSEIDKYAVSVFQRHFKEATNYGDITKINADELPDFDCLVGGFPCQAFSIAGHRKGFDDIRGTLFFDLARILRTKRPRYFVFENVEGLTNHDHGNTFRTILATIDELRYDCQWQIINSKNHGVPQNRKRIIIVGHTRGTPRPQIFPLGNDNGETANPATDKGTIVDLTFRQPKGFRVRSDERAGTLDANYYKGIANQERPGVLIGTLRTYKDGEGFREMKSGLSPTLPARAREDGSGQPVILVREATKRGYAEATIGDTVDITQVNSKTRRGRVGRGASPTLDTAMNLYTLESGESGAYLRRLTPIECERLQAFPDNWTKYGIEWITDNHGLLQQRLKAVSDTQRYKMCGNAVTTNVIEAVFERLFAK